MDAKLHWVEVLGQRFPVVAKTRQAALVTILKKLRREAKVGVASMNEVYQAGRDGVEILGVGDADSAGNEDGGSDGDDEAGGEGGDGSTRERRGRGGGRGRRARGSHMARSRAEGAS